MKRGAAAGLRQGLWLLALMVPISLAVTILRWAGVLAAVAAWVKPALQLLGLPGETAVALITAAAMNLYTGIAVMISIPLTARQVTVLGMMMLICHNLPVEAAVQRKVGSSPWRLVLLRMGAAVAAGLALNLLLPAGDAAVRAAASQVTPAFTAMLREWVVGRGREIVKVFLIVMALMVLHQVLEEFGLARWLAQRLAPIVRVLGLSGETAFLWMVANLLGLAYGGAVMIEEARAGKVRKEDAETFNRSVAVCHSLLEDTLLLVWVGAWAFWITVPRVALAAGVVWAYRAGRFVAGRRQTRGEHK